jgi:hypothetical protein
MLMIFISKFPGYSKPIMKTGCLALLGALLWALLLPALHAADYMKTAGGLAIYLGVLPAELAQGHPPQHPEGRMHGGVPSTKRQHHVVAAVFDTKDGSRVTDAQVTAGVAEVGLGRTEKRLEPMVIDKTISYGNYFSMGGPGPYRIEIKVLRAAGHRPVTAVFEYSHPRR